MGEEGKEKVEEPQIATASSDPQTGSKTRRFLPQKQTPRKLTSQSPVIKLSRLKQPGRSRAVVKGGRTGKVALVGGKKDGDSSCEVLSCTVKELSMSVQNDHLLKTNAGSANTNMDTKTATCQPTHSQTEENPSCINSGVAELSKELVSATSDMGLGEPNSVSDQPCYEDVTPIIVTSGMEKPFSSGKLLTQSETHTRAVRRSPRKNKWTLEDTSATNRREAAASAGGPIMDDEAGQPGVLKREKRSQRHKKVGSVKYSTVQYSSTA